MRTRVSRSWRAPIAVAACGASFGLLFGACSLGLDEAKITAATSDASSEAATSDAPSDVAAEASSATYTPCTTAKDCPAPNACTTPRCDDARKVCVYDQCPTTQACSALACDPIVLACGTAPATYAFRAAQIKLPPGDTVGCGNAPGRCFAASYPFVFAGVASGAVRAYAVANPGNALPPLVPIEGLAFAPAVIVASGPRVWFFGTRFASNGVTKLPVAALDVPTNPTVTKLTARTVYLTQPAPDGIDNVFPTDNGAVLITLDQATALTARLDTLPATDGALDFHSVTVPNNGSIVAASGSRLVIYRFTGPAIAPHLFFSLVANAGTSTSQTGTEQDLAALGPTYANATFSPTPGGGVAMTASFASVDDAGTNGVKAVRLASILDSAQSTSFTATQKVDYETYPGALPSQAVLGASAAIDATRSIALAGVKTDGGSATSVQIVQRSTLGVVPDSRTTLPGDPSRWAVAGSNGFGYAFGVEGSGSDTFPSVYVFAPQCK
ncbi:MAG: hypothetical protein JWM74_3340 [Myxococcaceae bacterium]|nr:hypothetical protein [Myxococcaceae bacterium]